MWRNRICVTSGRKVVVDTRLLPEQHMLLSLSELCAPGLAEMLVKYYYDIMVSEDNKLLIEA